MDTSTAPNPEPVLDRMRREIAAQATMQWDALHAKPTPLPQFSSARDWLDFVVQTREAAERDAERVQRTGKFELLPPGNAPAAKWENPSSQGTASASSPKLRAPSMRGRALDAMRAAGSPGSAPATVAQPRSLPVSSSSHNSLLDAARPQPAGFPPAALERRADEERGVQHEAWINSPLNPQPRLGTSGAAAGWSDRRAP